MVHGRSWEILKSKKLGGVPGPWSTSPSKVKNHATFFIVPNEMEATFDLQRVAHLSDLALVTFTMMALKVNGKLVTVYCSRKCCRHRKNFDTSHLTPWVKEVSDCICSHSFLKEHAHQQCSKFILKCIWIQAAPWSQQDRVPTCLSLCLPSSLSLNFLSRNRLWLQPNEMFGCNHWQSEELWLHFCLFHDSNLLYRTFLQGTLSVRQIPACIRSPAFILHGVRVILSGDTNAAESIRKKLVPIARRKQKNIGLSRWLTRTHKNWASTMVVLKSNSDFELVLNSDSSQ